MHYRVGRSALGRSAPVGSLISTAASSRRAGAAPNPTFMLDAISQVRAFTADCSRRDSLSSPSRSALPRPGFGDPDRRPLVRRIPARPVDRDAHLRWISSPGAATPPLRHGGALHCHKVGSAPHCSRPTPQWEHRHPTPRSHSTWRSVWREAVGSALTHSINSSPRFLCAPVSRVFIASWSRSDFTSQGPYSLFTSSTSTESAPAPAARGKGLNFSPWAWRHHPVEPSATVTADRVAGAARPRPWRRAASKRRWPDGWLPRHACR
jgi:hypothetical protein